MSLVGAVYETSVLKGMEPGFLELPGIPSGAAQPGLTPAEAPRSAQREPGTKDGYSGLDLFPHHKVKPCLRHAAMFILIFQFQDFC